MVDRIRHGRHPIDRDGAAIVGRHRMGEGVTGIDREDGAGRGREEGHGVRVGG